MTVPTSFRLTKCMTGIVTTIKPTENVYLFPPIQHDTEWTLLPPMKATLQGSRLALVPSGVPPPRAQVLLGILPKAKH